MKGFRSRGGSPSRTTLFTRNALDDWGGRLSNPVRAVDVFVDALGTGRAGVSMASPRQRPAGRDIIRRPMLKLYIFGLSQPGFQFEPAAGSVRPAANMEVMWFDGDGSFRIHKNHCRFPQKTTAPPSRRSAAQFVAFVPQDGAAGKKRASSRSTAASSRRSIRATTTTSRREMIGAAPGADRGERWRRLSEPNLTNRRSPEQLPVRCRRKSLVARTTRLKEKLIKLEEEVKRP